MRERPEKPIFGPESSSLAPRRAAAARVKPWRSLAKAVSWRVVGTLDTLLLSFLVITFLGPLFGLDPGRSNAENLGTAGYIATAEIVTKIGLYYLHERLWARIRWDMRRDKRGGSREGPRRSGVKTATWRVLASLDTFLLALIFTGNAGAALSIGGLEVVTKLALYFVHERVWAHVQIGLERA